MSKTALGDMQKRLEQSGAGEQIRRAAAAALQPSKEYMEGLRVFEKAVGSLPWAKIFAEPPPKADAENPMRERMEALGPQIREAWRAWQADKTAVAPVEPQREAESPKSLLSRVMDRLNDPDWEQHNRETFDQTHLDVLRERFGGNHPAYERLMEMADSLDKEHNLPYGRAYTPMGWYNKYHKDKLREAFDKMGIKRKY